MVADYPNDVTAIAEAHEFLRNGETIEVWREGTMIYRTSPRIKSV
jgi:two-component sensor histidine kinase